MKKQKNRVLLQTKKLWKHTWLRRSLYGIVGIFLLILLAPIINPLIFRPIEKGNFGVSFSVPNAKSYGSDWKDNYTALLDDMNIKHFRLMSYWSEIEPSRGKFDFKDLDWQIEQAAKRGADVTLAIGLRQPRWPECHQPSWTFGIEGNAWKQALYAYMKVVVDRYKNTKTVISWQLENEAMNRQFGRCLPPDRDRLVEEYSLVKKWVPRKQLWMTLSDQHGLPLGTPVPDRYGFSVYRTVYSTGLYTGYFTFPTPIWYHNLRKTAIDSIQRRGIFIHELQLEPWGPKGITNLTNDEQDKSMSFDQMKESIAYTQMIGASDIYGWGAEWWYWKKQNGDDRFWQYAKEFNQRFSER